MAEYRDLYADFRGAGAEVAAIAVDPPATSEALRAGLGLGFPILCDTDRRVVREWSLYNERERGGIAQPAVFLLDSSLSVLFRSVDSVRKRVPAAGLLAVLRAHPPGLNVERKVYWPGIRDWARAISNAIRFPMRSSGK